MTYEQFCRYVSLDPSENFHMFPGNSFPRGKGVVEFTLVSYVISGQCIFRIDGTEYVAKPQHLLMITEGQEIETIDMSEDYRFMVIVIGGDLEKELNINNSFLSMFLLKETSVVKVSDEYKDSARHFFEALNNLDQLQNNPYKADCIRSVLRAFFYNSCYFLGETLGYKSSRLFEISQSRTAMGNTVHGRFIQLVEKHASKHRTLSFYAEILDYNPRYLSNLIKRETGFSGQQMIEQYALVDAMSKLRYSKRSIKEISNEMEFPSQSDFGKYFKRLTGCSPVEYRKRQTRATRG